MGTAARVTECGKIAQPCRNRVLLLERPSGVCEHMMEADEWLEGGNEMPTGAPNVGSGGTMDNSERARSFLAAASMGGDSEPAGIANGLGAIGATLGFE
jgi:hypothetical protein